MTTIVAVLQRAARQCSVNEPSSWLTATGAAQVELRDDFLQETIDELQKRIDWASPIGKQTVITGDGTTVAHSLPSNYVRLANDEWAVYETNTVRRIGSGVVSDGQWTHINEIGTGGGARFYKLEGYEGNWTISFYPTLGSGETVTVSYISNVWMATSGGSEGSTFTDVNDVILYPRRPLELGTIWRFRKRKGMQFEDIYVEYEAWVATQANRQRSNRPILFGSTGNKSHPMRHPVPDEIPSS
jgi:hypothetical protein